MNVYVVTSGLNFGGVILGIYSAQDVSLQEVEKLYEDAGFDVEIEVGPLQTKLEIR